MRDSLDFAVYQKAIASERDVVKLLTMRDSLNTVLRSDNSNGSERQESQKTLRAVLDQLVAVGHGVEAAPKIPDLPKPASDLVGDTLALRSRVNDLASKLQNNTPDRSFDKVAANLELAGLWQALAESERNDAANQYGADRAVQQAATRQKAIDDSVALAGTFDLSGKGAGAT